MTELVRQVLQDESDAAVYNIDLDGFREGLPSLYLPPRPPIRTDPDRPTRSPCIRAIRWAELGDGERQPCAGCRHRKYYDKLRPRPHYAARQGRHRRRREPLTALLVLQPHQGRRLTMAELRERLLTDKRHNRRLAIVPPPVHGVGPRAYRRRTIRAVWRGSGFRACAGSRWPTRQDTTPVSGSGSSSPWVRTARLDRCP